MYAAARSRKPGFTLVELLIVIVIIGVLAGLLVPAIWSAVRRANDARVAADIQVLAQGLESFKAKFGSYPPSRVILVEDGGYRDINVGSLPEGFYGLQSSGDSSNGMSYIDGMPPIGDVPFTSGDHDVNVAALVQRSIRALRKYFPRVNLSATANSVFGQDSPTWYDFNGNGLRDAEPILLEGHECLVFFLGGIPGHNVDGNGNYTLTGMSGFSTNPTNPFTPQFDLSTGGPIPGAQSRIEPFFEFNADRLIDDDFDGIPGYVDTLGTTTNARYFAYFSSYDGAGYDPNDVNFDPVQLNETGLPVRSYRVSFPLATVDQDLGPRFTTSPLPNPYTSSDTVPAGGTVNQGGVPASFIDAQSFQIISAGRDRRYGAGGQFDSTSEAIRLPEGQNDPRVTEADNITNFTNGTLE